MNFACSNSTFTPKIPLKLSIYFKYFPRFSFLVSYRYFYPIFFIFVSFNFDKDTKLQLYLEFITCYNIPYSSLPIKITYYSPSYIHRILRQKTYKRKNSKFKQKKSKIKNQKKKYDKKQT